MKTTEATKGGGKDRESGIECAVSRENNAGAIGDADRLASEAGDASPRGVSSCVHFDLTPDKVQGVFEQDINLPCRPSRSFLRTSSSPRGDTNRIENLNEKLKKYNNNMRSDTGSTDV